MPSVFLVGFMASGKSSVGAALAAELGLPFVDLDQRVEERAGRSIPELFEQRGEDRFRRAEAEALAEVAGGEPAVVATGGGAPCHGDNLEVMRRGGWVVHLSVPLDEALRRAGDGGGRPLLSRPPAEVRALYERRQPVYRRAHATVDATGRGPEAIARGVAELVRATDRFPRALLGEPSLLPLGERSHPVVVDRGALDRLGAIARAAVPRARTAGLVTDDVVGPLYLDRARTSLAAAGFEIVVVTVPAGEGSKQVDAYARAAGALISGGLDRSSMVVALGGGVVGDLAGFVAATLYRGVAFLQVPTTILAMTDSAIGGKTGINTAEGKNLLGAFWQPAAVVADPDVLATLPVRERRASVGELAKYGLLDGDELLGEVDRLAPGIGGDELVPGDELAHLVRRCAAVKASIVGADERESGVRALLNLGHTIGHAIEASAGYGTLLHGEAVALGLVAACRVSARLGQAEPALEGRVAGLLGRAGLDADVDPWLGPEVLRRVGVDKKRTGTRLRFITVAAPGDARLTDVELAELEELVRP